MSRVQPRPYTSSPADDCGSILARGAVLYEPEPRSVRGDDEEPAEELDWADDDAST
jgi:hypothetical protein